jgi:hypothetical protein
MLPDLVLMVIITHLWPVWFDNFWGSGLVLLCRCCVILVLADFLYFFLLNFF